VWRESDPPCPLRSALLATWCVFSDSESVTWFTHECPRKRPIWHANNKELVQLPIVLCYCAVACTLVDIGSNVGIESIACTGLVDVQV